MEEGGGVLVKCVSEGSALCAWADGFASLKERLGRKDTKGSRTKTLVSFQCPGSFILPRLCEGAAEQTAGHHGKVTLVFFCGHRHSKDSRRKPHTFLHKTNPTVSQTSRKTVVSH